MFFWFFSFNPCPRLLEFSKTVMLVSVANAICAVCVLFFKFVPGLTQCLYCFSLLCFSVCFGKVFQSYDKLPPGAF